MNNMTAHDKHEFALYKESLSLLVQHKTPGDSILFADEHLLHRMIHVLRLGKNDTCVFFDRNIYVSAAIDVIGKKQIQVTLQSIHPTKELHPHITFLLPVLKREDYEAALYALTEVGVNTIQLVFTQKTGNKWAQERDGDRAHRIIISAAEQSKNFAYPELQSPIFLQEALKKYDNWTKLFFDPQGTHLFDVMQTLRDTKPEHIALLVGPEGDLTVEEKRIVRENNFMFCSLTPTIVRAVQATTLAAGFVRSLLV